MRVNRKTFLSAALAACATLAASAVGAQEVTLKAVNAFQEGTYFAKTFEDFVKKVNAEGKGVLQINYLGGPKAMPASEHATALRRGVIDIANTTASYTANLVPEGMALNFTNLRMDALRKNGAIDYLNAIYNEKGLHYLGRTAEGLGYHIYTNKRFDKLDLKGQKLRSASVYRDLFAALGVSSLQTAPGEVYTALERGVVDGIGWPLVGIFDLGWHEKLKYRVDPGFYSLEVGMLISSATLAKLTPAQRSFLERQVAAMEAGNWARAKADGEAEVKRMEAAGIKAITLDPQSQKQFLDLATSTAWEGMKKVSPKHAEKLQALMSGS